MKKKKPFPSNRAPHQATYKYTQRGVPEKEVIPRLHAPRVIQQQKTTNRHKGLTNIATQPRWHNNMFVGGFRWLPFNVTLRSNEGQATKLHILPAGQLLRKTFAVYTKESTGLSN
jgi:hypothetical protein